MDYSKLYCNHHESSKCQCCSFAREVLGVTAETFPYIRHFRACLVAAFENGNVRLRGMMSDLITHDKASLVGADVNLPFAFAVRSNGTHLVRIIDHDGVGHMSYDYPGFVGDSFASEPVQWYWWDGQELKELPTYTEAARLLRVECSKRGISYSTVRGLK